MAPKTKAKTKKLPSEPAIHVEHGGEHGELVILTGMGVGLFGLCVARFRQKMG